MNHHAYATENASDFERPGDASRKLWSTLISEFTDGATTPSSIPLSLPGRYLMQDGAEFPCRTLEISPLGISMRGEVGGYPGEWVVAQIRALGAIEGVIVRKAPISFIIDVRETPVRLERLSKRIGWLLRRDRENLPDRREHERVEQMRKKALLRTLDGREIVGELLDLSLGGAAVHLGAPALYLWPGMAINLDGRTGQVLRRFPEGVVVKFDDALETP